MGQRNKTVVTIGVMLSFLLFYLCSGNFTRLLEGKNLAALGELVLVGLMLLALHGLAGRSRGKLFGGAGLVLLGELYLHQMLLPFFASLAYAGLLLFLVLLLFGELGNLRFFRHLGLRGLIDKLLALRSAALQYLRAPRNGEEKYLLLALPFLLIQLNRMNIAVDYDSLRYGLRSQYVLFNGDFFSALGQVNAVYTYPKGLEILTYPLSSFRCFALLLMFSFWCYLLCLLLIGIMTAELTGNRRRGFQAFLCLSMVSALGNMSITAKTDLITLLCQLYMLWLFLRGEKTKSLAAAILTLSFKPTAVVFTTASFAVLFFGDLLLERMARQERGQDDVLPAVAGDGIAGGTDSGSAACVHPAVKVKSRFRGFPALLVCLLFTGLVTARTWIITGVPFSTTFTSVFQALGCTVHWPFNFDAHVDYGSSTAPTTALLNFLRRLLLFLFCPVGEDMAHVEIAWGGVEIPLLLIPAICACRRYFPQKRGFSGENNVDKSRQLVTLLFLLLSILSLLTFYMLWQVDGNYYMLWDSVLVLTAFLGLPAEAEAAVTANSVSAAAETAADSAVAAPGIVAQDGIGVTAAISGDSGQIRRRPWLARPLLLFVYTASLLTTLITSWSGAVGFTPIRLLNRGYYDNISEIREFETGRGAAALWAEMSMDPENRVLAFAATPDCYKILCNVQSITDVEGSGGSPGLYDSLTYFEWFLRWAETDYLYLEADFLRGENEDRAREMLLALCGDGVLYDFHGTEDKLLCRVDQERLIYAWNSETAPAADEDRVAESLAALTELLTAAES